MVILIVYNYNLKGTIKQNWKPECGTSLEEYSAARKSHYHIAKSNSNHQLQGRMLLKCAAINASLDISKPPKRKEAYMAATSAQILGWWPAAVGCVGCIAAVIVAVRYKIPDLARRVEAMETKNPTKHDLNTVVDSFRTVCKFNQATCQKSNAAQIEKVRRELDQKLSDLYDLINKQAVIIARVDERVAALHGGQAPIDQG